MKISELWLMGDDLNADFFGWKRLRRKNIFFNYYFIRQQPLL